MSDIADQLLLQLILILLNAFFAATEIAVISLNEKHKEKLAEGTQPFMCAFKHGSCAAMLLYK